MSKFNVGDKVKIIRDCDSSLSLRDRNIELGGEYVIESINPNPLNLHRDNYGLVGITYVVYDDELDLVESKSFTKSDLKDGMVIEHKDGDRYIVFGNILVSEDGNFELDRYDDNLIWDGYHEYDIHYVYKIKPTLSMNIEDIFKCDRYLELIWERKEPCKEMTVEEIEKELGYKIKVVADKE